jgi:hypothetical protein
LQSEEQKANTKGCWEGSHKYPKFIAGGRKRLLIGEFFQNMIKKGDKKSQLLEYSGIGKSLAWIERPGYLSGQRPATQSSLTTLDSLCKLRGNVLDRCVWYVFKCAVYYAEQSSRS